MIIWIRGESRIFSVEAFIKKFSKILTNFFKLNGDIIWRTFSAPLADFQENQAKKPFLGNFLRCRFFLAGAPLTVSLYSAKSEP